MVENNKTSYALNGYRYDPKDFKYSLPLCESMSGFYEAIEMYRRDNTKSNMYELDRQRDDLFLAIKHRVVEGRIPEYRADEMRDRFWELYDEVTDA
jgi:hypothetical protein